MSDLTVLVPTRGRIGSSLRLLEAFRATCTADTELVFVISADDPDHDLYYWHLTKANGRAITVDVDKPGVVAPLNAAFDALKGSLGFAVGYMGDDHLPKTRGWDTELLKDLKALESGFAYGNDLLQGAKLPTAVVMTTDIPKALGWMAPPELSHFYIDDFWLVAGKVIDKIVYRDDVVIEHLHPSVRKGRKDATYTRSATLEEDDLVAFRVLEDSGFSGAVEALNEALKPAPKKAPAKRAPAKKAAPKKAADK